MYQVPEGLSEKPEEVRKRVPSQQQRVVIGGERLASPDEVMLRGTIRRESMASSLGRIELRWPRSVENLFGRTPVRAMSESARAVGRALKKRGFPAHVKNLDIDWNVVFLDAELPSEDIPSYLVSNCHPAWMTPPSNLYIVAQRVVEGCGGKRSASTSVADEQLAQVLIHEIAHGVEFALIPRRFQGDRKRSEGFATWFEFFAAQESPLLNSGNILEEQKKRALQSITLSPRGFRFSGSAFDYARAAMYFHVIVEKRNTFGLMSVYDLIHGQGLSFYAAVEKYLYWDPAELDERASAFARQ